MSRDEVEAIASIYCSPGEFAIKNDGVDSIIFTVNIKSEPQVEANGTVVLAEVTFSVKKTYPDHSPPDLSIVSSQLTREGCSKLRSDLLEYASSLIGQPMIMDMIIWVKENVSNYLEKNLSNTSSVDKSCGNDTAYENVASNSDNVDWVMLLQLDHMRAKARYVKTIKKWTEELNLKGRLLFQGHLILIILQGQLSNLKEYVTKQKTVNVDVDSKGRSCKERMLSVLAEEQLVNAHAGFKDFSVLDVNSMQELKEIFSNAHLQHLFTEYVSSKITR